MKNLIVIFLTFVSLLIFTDLVIAKDLSNKNKYCKSISKVAEITMRYRHRGITMSHLIEKYKNINEKYKRQDLPIFKSLIKAAYKEPIHFSEGYKRVSIENFRDKIYLQCITICPNIFF